MPQSKKTKKIPTLKKPTKSEKLVEAKDRPVQKSVRTSTPMQWVAGSYSSVRSRTARLTGRRPHHSFRMTKRRDYKRSLKLPGYWNFTMSAVKILWAHRKLFGGLILTYIIVTIIINGVGEQAAYSNLADTLTSTSGDLFKGNFGSIAQAGLLLVSSVSTGLSPDITQAQTVLAGFATFFGWLTSVWLLRNIMAGHKPRLRDGLYNSGSPVLATVLVAFIILLQLLPTAVALIIYTAAQNSGLLDGGVSAMLVWASVILLVILSVYWITSSLLALVIVTLPGMYPLRAIRTAGDLIIGRRLRVLYRIAWLAVVTVLTWAIIVIPIILFDSWIKKLAPAINWVPFVPLAIIIMSAVSLIYISAYIYLLYRRIVDDDASPA